MADRALLELKGFNLFGKPMVIINLTRWGNRMCNMPGKLVISHLNKKERLRTTSGFQGDKKESRKKVIELLI